MQNSKRSIAGNNDCIDSAIVILLFFITCIGYLYAVSGNFGGEYLKSAILWGVALVVVGPAIFFIKSILGDSLKVTLLAIVSFGSFFIATQADSLWISMAGVFISLVSAIILLGYLEAFYLLREGFYKATRW